MTNPASEGYKKMFGDPQALTEGQQEILDAMNAQANVKPSDTAGRSQWKDTPYGPAQTIASVMRDDDEISDRCDWPVCAVHVICTKECGK